MDAADITVKELTERAHIHRKTFYLHYTCIEALFEDLLGQITEEYYHAIDQLPIPTPHFPGRSRISSTRFYASPPSIFTGSGWQTKKECRLRG